MATTKRIGVCSYGWLHIGKPTMVMGASQRADCGRIVDWGLPKKLPEKHCEQCKRVRGFASALAAAKQEGRSKKDENPATTLKLF